MTHPRSFAARRPAAALLAALLVLGACAEGAGGDPRLSARRGETAGHRDPDGDPVSWATAVVIPRPSRPDDAELSRADLVAFQESFDAACDLQAHHEYERALAIVDEALTFGPPKSSRLSFETLRRELEMVILERTWIDAFVRLENERWTIGEPITGDVVLMNISDKRLVIPARQAVETLGSQSVEARTILRTKIRYREYLPDYTLIESEEHLNFVVDQDIVLERGRAHRFPLAIETLANNPGGTMYRTYVLSCELHPTEVRVGEKSVHGVLRFRPATAPVFPRNAEHLANDPAGRLREALRRASPLHLTIAAALVGDSQREEAFDILGEALARPDCPESSKLAIMSALRILSGVELPQDVAAWRRWLREERR